MRVDSSVAIGTCSGTAALANSVNIASAAGMANTVAVSNSVAVATSIVAAARGSSMRGSVVLGDAIYQSSLSNSVMIGTCNQVLGQAEGLLVVGSGVTVPAGTSNLTVLGKGGVLTPEQAAPGSVVVMANATQVAQFTGAAASFACPVSVPALTCAQSVSAGNLNPKP